MTEQDTELAIYRDNVRRFTREQVAPFYDSWERAEIMPREIWLQLGEAGMLGTDIPEQYGGIGADFRFSVVVQQELARAGFLALACSIAVHSDIVSHYVLNAGSETQKQHYLPRMVSGECVGAIAMTEPGAGSDLQAIRASAQADGDGWKINGSKTFITNGQHADLVITAAKTDPGARGSKSISLLLVDADAPGFSRGRNLEKLGQHAADTSELFYTDVRVGPDKLLGELNRGFAVLMNELPRERLVLAIGGAAHARGALDITVAYVKERNVFGQPLAAMQNTRFRLAEMAAEVTVHERFLDSCIASLMRDELDTATASIAKLSCTELQDRVADGCLQLFGGYGYMREYPISRFYADSRVQRIYGGASEVMKELISRDVLK
ncbi:MAG: acyl-CoA dehydrogenase family protein [Gammaproteobacteria bacterium]|jgi:acyl-CoA dehydrogenase|nr:acyl-CoA dehydrogenase family protein [Gammaproteobacteria bacterium]MBP6228978.1 acyl-CoA dehydrogenase family protein [Pseudomonadales bacterium]MBK6582097.1 acyl-CoA dehydrogenase family protein [Gammaproteobacteria bacterium]MBK7171563.1 acyl-CoA dehydrogenase family protein [Gammaproteobacteria bacterium]MBK7521629.1 acyl-CoA dehydrogenase family protein [Gammaproteobacteria bacterium]